MQKFAIILLLSVLPALSLTARRHTELAGVPLNTPVGDLIERLVDKGLRQEDSLELSGTVMGLDVWLTLGADKDSTGCGYILLTTQEQQGASQRDDYQALMRWMQRHYGRPDWEATVRSQSFARWFVDFDRDIVMLAPASGAVEIWFYENHETRNLDYYSILKYCERHPAPDVPYYTARDCVVWKSKPGEVQRKKKWTRKRRRATRKRGHTRQR